MTVDTKLRDMGVMTVLLRRMYTQRLPRIMFMKAKVERGERLDDYDINFLHHVLADTRSIQPTIERHPEYQQLASRLITLYKSLIEHAIENEKDR